MREGGTYEGNQPIHTGHQTARNEPKKADDEAKARRGNADAVRDKHNLVHGVQCTQRRIHVPRRKPDILQRNKSTCDPQLVLQNGDGVEGEHGTTGAVCDDVGRAMSAGSFAVAHHLRGVKVVDTKQFGGGLDDLADEFVGGIIDNGETSVRDVDFAISNVRSVKLGSTGGC